MFKKRDEGKNLFSNNQCLINILIISNIQLQNWNHFRPSRKWSKLSFRTYLTPKLKNVLNKSLTWMIQILVITPNPIWITDYGLHVYNQVMDVFATYTLGGQYRDQDSKCIFYFLDSQEMYNVCDNIFNNSLAQNAFYVPNTI